MKRKSLLIAFAASIVATYSLAQDAIPLKGDELFGSMRARHIGPALMSGRITDLELHPKDPKVVYVGTAGGGIWVSKDAGVTYNPIFDKHIQSIGCVKVDPTNPDQVVWAGTGEVWTRNSVSVGDGIYKTTDGGQNWKKMGLEKSEHISSIVINPTNSNEVYAGVMGNLWGDSDERGVYKTTDGGQTWNKIFSINNTTGCSELVMDSANPNVLYAAFWEFRRTAYSFSSGGANSALYKSTDGGKTWNKIHNGFPSGKLGRIAVAVAPSNSNILYSVIESEKDEDKGLYRSDDAGATWKRLNGDFELVVRPFYFSRIVIDPKNPDIVLKAGLSGYLSKDGGKTFRSINGGVHSDFHDYAFDINDSNKIYVGTDGGVYRSYDGGTVWEMVKGLPVSQFYHVTFDNQKPYKVYGGLQDNGSWVGLSSKPGGIENRDWISVGYGDGFRVFPHPTDPNIVYSEMQGAEYIWRYDIKKSQAKVIKPFAEEGDPKLRFNWNASLTTSQHYPDRVYVGSQYVHVSDDRGETWRKISADLTTNDSAKQNQEDSGGLSKDNSGAENHCTIFTINESPLDKDMLWVGTDDGNIQVTLDGGKNWKNVTANLTGVPKNTWVHYIEPSHFDKNTAYAVFDGHAQNDRKPYVLKTTDGGNTWASIATDEIKDFARSIKEDHKNPNLLFLGTEQGLYITVDGGKNWSRFENNLPPVAIHYLALHPTEDALLMATHGRGIVIIDDISPLRAITKDILTKELAFITTKPSIIREAGGFGGYSSVGEFVGENPASAAQIVYFMNKRHTFGKMTLEIFDANNKKVADLSPGKGKGLNAVSWAYRLNPPKIAKAKTIANGGFGGPVVPAGTYKVVITKGKNTFENNLVLVNDPESIHTPADRVAYQESATKLYNMNEELAYLVEKLNVLTEGVERVKPLISVNKKLEKRLQTAKLATDLADFKKTLVVTTGDNYVAAAEPELREKIASLFGEVIDYLGKPSNAQLANLKLLDGKLTEAKNKMVAYEKQMEAINQTIIKAKLATTAITLPTWEAFKESK